MARIIAGPGSTEKLALAGAAPVSAQLPGAIFTTVADGSRVNANVCADKCDVCLNGGPGPNAPPTAAGLPDGDYYFQVTDPSGQVLLSTDPVINRQFNVQGGNITGGRRGGARGPGGAGRSGA